MQLGIRIVDATYNDPPEQKRDVFWDEEVEPLYSEESAKVSGENDKLIGSTAQIRLKKRLNCNSSMTPLFIIEITTTKKLHQRRVNFRRFNCNVNALPLSFHENFRLLLV